MPSQKGRRTSKSRRASPWQGSVRLGLVFAVLIGVNVYFFFLRGGTSLRALMKTTELQKAKAEDPSAEEARVVDGTMADNDTVERRWKADGLPPATVNAIATSLGKMF